jgi:hypothetical protein
MKEEYVLAEDGYEIQVGDIIQKDSAFGVSRKVVTRVTPKFAFYPNNEVSESKFKRIYSTFGWGSLPRPTYPMVRYKLFRKPN